MILGLLSLQVQYIVIQHICNYTRPNNLASTLFHESSFSTPSIDESLVQVEAENCGFDPIQLKFRVPRIEERVNSSRSAFLGHATYKSPSPCIASVRITIRDLIDKYIP